LCAAVGLLVATLGMGSLYGMSIINVKQAETIENRMQQAHELSDGQIAADPVAVGQTRSSQPSNGDLGALQHGEATRISCGWRTGRLGGDHEAGGAGDRR